MGDIVLIPCWKKVRCWMYRWINNFATITFFRRPTEKRQRAMMLRLNTDDRALLLLDGHRGLRYLLFVHGRIVPVQSMKIFLVSGQTPVRLTSITNRITTGNWFYRGSLLYLFYDSGWHLRRMERVRNERIFNQISNYNNVYMIRSFWTNSNRLTLKIRSNNFSSITWFVSGIRGTRVRFAGPSLLISEGSSVASSTLGRCR